MASLYQTLSWMWWSRCPKKGKVQGRAQETLHRLSPTSLPEGEKKVWVCLVPVPENFPSLVTCYALQLLPTNSTAVYDVKREEVFLIPILAPVVCWRVPPITLTEPVTFLSCWVSPQMPFFIQILPASAAKEKKQISTEACYNSANTHLFV